MTDAVQERVLLVEDDDSLRQLLVEELEDRGLQVRALASAEEAVGSLESWEPALVVSDLRLPGADGMALLRRVKSMQAAPAFLVITAFGSIQQAVAALEKAPTNFSLPLDLEHFALAVGRALETRRLRDEVRRFQQLLSDDRFHGMLGRSRVMRGLFDQIRQLARAEGPVLVIGESGTGKELVARGCTPRASAPAARSWPSTAPGCRPSSWKASSSAMSPVPSPAPIARTRGCSNRPTAVRSFSTRSARCRCRCRPSSCACCRKARSARWVPSANSAWTCASSPPAIARWKPRPGARRSAKTCSSVWKPSFCRCRRCVIARRISNCWPPASSPTLPRAADGRCAASRRRRWSSYAAIRSRATCASCRTPLSGQ